MKIRVCRQWYSVLHDPYLYQHIVLRDIEFKQLLLSMKKLIHISPFIKSITMDGCYSDFIRTTIVSVPFSNSSCDVPPLYTHIRNLEVDRRRQEYKNHGYNLHQKFSNYFSQLMALKGSTITSLCIINCRLDFEMTELFCIIICAGHKLTSFYYENNDDQGIESPQLLQTLVMSTPNMRHFCGRHAGMNDVVLGTISRRWLSLETLTLYNLGKEDNSEGDNRNTLANISHQAFLELLCQCKELRSLELYDLACITNRDVALYNKEIERLKTKSKTRYQPYPEKGAEWRPGGSVCQLRITKYNTTPLSMPGFHDLLRLFPNLVRLEYVTNFNTFYNQFEGVTLELFEAEKASIDCLMKSKSLIYEGRWYEPMTAEQYLTAGLLRSLGAY